MVVVAEVLTDGFFSLVFCRHFMFLFSFVLLQLVFSTFYGEGMISLLLANCSMGYILLVTENIL